MKKEYDFSKGKKGKYYKKYHAGNNIILLEPELQKLFPDSEKVNEALKKLLELSKFALKKS
jgi:mannose/fructose/N-acetylgalactosamine-specific phosphotransferase system component IID